MHLLLPSTVSARPASEIPNGDRNKLFHSDRRFHDWYRFVLSFPPQLVRYYIQQFHLGADDLLLDPFCGTGTTLVESKLHNVPSIGIEANSFAHFASSVKIDWTADPIALKALASQIRDAATAELEKMGIQDDWFNSDPSEAILQSLAPEAEKLILRGSISPIPLHKTLVLLEKIDSLANSRFHKYFRLALGNALVYQISNLRFGPEVGVGRIKVDVPVVRAWFQEISRICDDLDFSSKGTYAGSRVYHSDARNVSALVGEKQVSAVITSPPYPNEKDYTRTTRLESVILGFITNRGELRALKKSLLRSNTRGVYKGDTDDEYVIQNTEVQRIAEEIEHRRIELGKTSGFERTYAKVTRLYFGGITKHLRELQPILKPNARMAYVVGDQASYLQVMIRTGRIIGEIAESLGYELVKIEPFRTRFSTATKTDLNEEVVVLRWPG